MGRRDMSGTAEKHHKCHPEELQAMKGLFLRHNIGIRPTRFSPKGLHPHGYHRYTLSGEITRHSADYKLG
jgi:hypothetical protein